MRALILAQGNGERWNDERGEPWGGTPKHFVRVEGEVLLERTVRQLRERSDRVAEIAVIGPDARYRIAGSWLFTLDNPFPVPCDMSKFLATQHLWSPALRTTLLWGDCYYTDDALDAIAGCDEPDVHYFRRPYASATTGHEWDESFAVTWPADAHARVLGLAYQVYGALVTGQLHATHIRTHYAAALGLRDLDNADLLVDTPGQTVIDDWTDDFDSPTEYLRWCERRQVIHA